MALGIVQAGCKNSLYLYAAGTCPEKEYSYAEWLAELTTELELALEGGTEEVYSNRKKEWEDLLEQSVKVEAMLRQMMENGLGQQKEEQKEVPGKREKEEPDNDFTLEGIPVNAEGKNRSSPDDFHVPGNSQFLQTNTGNGAEYLNLAGGGKNGPPQQQRRIICLTCETECEQKKQWKITE